ncbi:MAG: hypothetical protein ACM31L_01290 [Actinomycetota bacterium]
MRSEVEFAFLHEGSLLPFLFRLLGKKTVCVLWPYPAAHVLGRPFEGLVRWLGRKGRVVPRESAAGDALAALDRRVPERLDMYGEVEAWAAGYFGFDGAEDDFYARPFRFCAAKYVYDVVCPAAYLLEQVGPERTRYVPDEVRDVHDFWFGKGAARSRFRPRWWQPLANLAYALTALATGIVRIVSTLRLRRPRPQPVLLAADVPTLGGQPRHIRVLADIVDSPEDLLLVFRNGGQYRQLRQFSGPYASCLPTAEPLGPVQAAKALRQLVADLVLLVGRHWSTAPGIFWELVRLARVRISVNALLDNRPPRYFWCRDDYNSDHIIRSQELRRRGSKSLGIAHGVLAWGTCEGALRFLDFDVYYVFGLDLYQRYYCSRWRPEMKVEAVGSFGLGYDQLRQMETPRPPNILFFADTTVDEPDFYRAAIDIAEAFPDRTVYLKLKPGRIDTPHAAPFRAMAAEPLPANLVITDQDTYELMLDGRYSIGSTSSVVSEALQFGLVSLVLDVDTVCTYKYYSEYPEFIFRSAAAVIDYIRKIESGEARYDRSKFEGLVDLSGRVLADVVRADMGLPPRHPGYRFVPPEIGPG